MYCKKGGKRKRSSRGEETWMYMLLVNSTIKLIDTEDTYRSHKIHFILIQKKNSPFLTLTLRIFQTLSVVYQKFLSRHCLTRRVELFTFTISDKSKMNT